MAILQLPVGNPGWSYRTTRTYRYNRQLTVVLTSSRYLSGTGCTNVHLQSTCIASLGTAAFRPFCVGAMVCVRGSSPEPLSQVLCEYQILVH